MAILLKEQEHQLIFFSQLSERESLNRKLYPTCNIRWDYPPCRQPHTNKQNGVINLPNKTSADRLIMSKEFGNELVFASSPKEINPTSVISR